LKKSVKELLCILQRSFSFVQQFENDYRRRLAPSVRGPRGVAEKEKRRFYITGKCFLKPDGGYGGIYDITKTSNERMRYYAGKTTRNMVS
jgi:hypothetical protein